REPVPTSALAIPVHDCVTHTRFDGQYLVRHPGVECDEQAPARDDVDRVTAGRIEAQDAARELSFWIDRPRGAEKDHVRHAAAGRIRQGGSLGAIHVAPVEAAGRVTDEAAPLAPIQRETEVPDDVR